MVHKEVYIEFEGFLRRVLSLDQKGMMINKNGKDVFVPSSFTELFTMTYFLN